SLQPDLLTMAVGEESSFTTFAVYSDGSAEDVTDRVMLASSNRAVVTENGSLLQAMAPGTASVTVSFGGKTTVGMVQVLAKAVPVSLELQPSMVILPPNNSMDLIAN